MAQKLLYGGVSPSVMKKRDDVAVSLTVTLPMHACPHLDRLARYYGINLRTFWALGGVGHVIIDLLFYKEDRELVDQFFRLTWVMRQPYF